jgi:hypothetical protein
VRGQTPDALAWIRKNVPITGVARALDLTVIGDAAHCWREANHSTGDTHPSLGFTTQNRFRCFVCDSRPGSNLDLAMKVLGVDLAAALEWMRRHFTIPDHVRLRQRHDPAEWNRVTYATILDSGVWARSFTDAERNIFSVLWHRRNSQTGVCSLSYRGVLKISGLGSQNTVAAAIQKFEQLHLLEVVRESHRTSSYRFLEHLEFCELQRRTWETFQPEPRRTSPGSGADKRELSSGAPVSGVLHSTASTQALTPVTGAVSCGLASPTGAVSEREEQVLRLAQRG